MDEKVNIALLSEEKSNQMIVFVSSKGGVGKTVISVNLSVALANKGFAACILDGNFQFGDVNLALDIQPKLTISDMVQDVDSLSGSVISNYLQNHESGVKVLSAPLKPEYADLITPSAVRTISKKLLEQNDYLIVDLSSGLTELNINFMEIADKIFIVTDLEMAALKNTKTMMKTLSALEMSEKVKVVVNRGDMESLIKFKDVSGILDVEDPFFISNDFKIVSKSFNIGIPFVISKPTEKITNEINELAGKIYKSRYTPRTRRRKKQGLFDFFKRRRS
jgi:pilus assembly protein CpaE